MPTSHSRSPSVPQDEELRLPRPPGVIRRFWARHPLLADILIALVFLLLSLVPAGSVGSTTTNGDGVTVTTSDVVWAPLPLLVVAACVLLVWRRRLPLVVFLAAAIVAVSYLLSPIPLGGPLLLIASYNLAVYRSSRACWIGLGITMGAITALSPPAVAAGVLEVQVALNVIVVQGILGLIGALIGVNVGNRKRYLEAVIDRSRQLLVERDQQALLAAAAERARIAREMHDIVSHSLTVIVALSEGAAATKDHERAREAMDAAATTARGALTEMRAMLGVLRESGPDAPLIPTEPTAPADTVAAAQRAGYPVTLAVVGRREVPQPVRYAIGRIVQEGVTNAMRHAPRATAITVRIDLSHASVVIEIRNDGAHGTHGSDGYGLRGLRERAAHVGGTVTSGPTGEAGWMLRAVLPARAEESASAQVGDDRAEGATV